MPSHKIFLPQYLCNDLKHAKSHYIFSSGVNFSADSSCYARYIRVRVFLFLGAPKFEGFERNPIVLVCLLFALIQEVWYH